MYILPDVAAQVKEGIMLRYAVIFFVVALIAAAFGFLGDRDSRSRHLARLFVLRVPHSIPDFACRRAGSPRIND